MLLPHRRRLGRLRRYRAISIRRQRVVSIRRRYGRGIKDDGQLLFTPSDIYLEGIMRARTDPVGINGERPLHRLLKSSDQPVAQDGLDGIGIRPPPVSAKPISPQMFCLRL